MRRKAESHGPLPFLERHSISPRQRAKVVDWVIEVLSIFKQSPQTVFRALHLVDSYLRREQQPQTVTDLHLTGMACMLVASKLHEVVPIKLAQVVREIGKHKFSAAQVRDREARLLRTVEFGVNSASVFCFSRCLLEASRLPSRLAERVARHSLVLLKMFVFSYDVVRRFAPEHLAVYSLVIALKLSERSWAGFAGQQAIYRLIKVSRTPKGRILENLNFLRDYASGFGAEFAFNRLKQARDLV